MVDLVRGPHDEAQSLVRQGLTGVQPMRGPAHLGNKDALQQNRGALDPKSEP